MSASEVVDILLITWNRKEYVIKTLKNILSDQSNFNLYWWDNGSKDGTAELIDTYDDNRIVLTHKSESNVMQAEPTYWFLKNSTSKIIGKLDDDTIAPHGWIDKCKRLLHENKNIGMVGCWTFYPEDYERNKKVAINKVKELNKGQILQNFWIGGTAFLMMKSVAVTYLIEGNGKAFPVNRAKMSLDGYISGWYFPLIHAEHMDDPRSINCLTNSTSQPLALTARVRGLTTNAEFLKWIKSDADLILTTSLNSQKKEYLTRYSLKSVVYNRTREAISRFKNHYLLKSISDLQLSFTGLLKYIGIKKIVRKVVSYGFQSMIENHPLIYKKMVHTYETNEIDELIKSIHNKGLYLKISRGTKVMSPRGLIIGNNVHIGESAYLNCRGGLSIGSNTHIRNNVNITTSKSNFEGVCLPFDSIPNDQPVRIGNNVYIDDNVSILPGVTIGEGAVIKSGLTIVNNIPDRAIVSTNNNNYLINYRDLDTYSQLKSLQSYVGIAGEILPLNKINKYSGNLNKDGKDVFFILGTGRSGSTTIANALSQHNKITCLHEPKLQLIRISTNLLHGKISRKEAEKELRDLYLKDTKIASPIYGESDQKLSNLIGLIHKIMPNAKFIWLIRDPIKTVNSTYSRGWFSNKEMRLKGQDQIDNNLYAGIYSDYRPRGDLSGQISANEWLNMSEFERNCWY